jgi:hypothetical protein
VTGAITAGQRISSVALSRCQVLFRRLTSAA